jgi:hypothetical protein
MVSNTSVHADVDRTAANGIPPNVKMARALRPGIFDLESEMNPEWH